VALFVGGFARHAEIAERFVGQGIQLAGEDAAFGPTFPPQAERICHVHDEISFLCWQNSPIVNATLNGGFRFICLYVMVLWHYLQPEKRVILTLFVRKTHI
jgi:hypothetical protein